MKTVRKEAVRVLALAAGATMVVGFANRKASADEIWTGATTGGDGSSWNSAANWSNNAIPTTTDNITISTSASPPSPAGSVVNFNVAAGLSTSGTLNIGSGETLTAGATEGNLVLSNGHANDGLTNAGTIDFAGGPTTTWGVIIGAISGTTGNTNSGLIESTGGGTLTFGINNASGGITNTSGTIETTNSSTIVFADPTFNGQGIKLIGGQVINGAGSTMTNGNNATSIMYFTGVGFQNNGTFVNTQANTGSLSDATQVTLQTGTAFTNSSTGRISMSLDDNGATTGGSLNFNVGTSNTDTTTMDNAVGGTITVADNDNYTASTGTAAEIARMNIQVGGTVTNEGAITINNSSNASSTGINSNTAYLDLIHGTLSNSGTLSIENNSSAVSGTNNSTAYIILAGGALTNNNAIDIVNNATGSTNNAIAGINLTASSAITGTGTIAFTGTGANSKNDYVNGTANDTFTLGAGQTLSGALQLGMGSLNLTNNGVIYANGSNPIVISTYNSAFTNTGTLKVAGGSTLEVTNTDPTNALAFGAGGNVMIDIDTDNLALSGTIADSGGLNLTNASLAITESGSTLLSVGDTITIMTSTGITGTFSQSQVSYGSDTFQIGYVNNDVVLTSEESTPEPGSAALLAVGILGLMHRRRGNRVLA